MKSLKFVLALLALLAGAIGAARAADLSHAVMLTASEELAGTAYEGTILIAAPLRGGHMGFIVNRPTEVKLAAIFPEHAPSYKVVDPIYVGGPVYAEGIFAVTRTAPEGDVPVIALMPGLVAVIDAPGVDLVIETRPNDARYFAGLMLWAPGALEDEIHAGYWHVQPASAAAVFLKQ